MADAAHEQIDVDASPARCFAVASEFEAYPQWTSDVKQVTVLERDAHGRGTRVEYHVSGLGRRVRYVLDYDFTDAPAAFSWSLVEGDLLRALDGRYAFAPNGADPDEDGTHVDYTLRVDLAVPMPGLVKRRASGMIMGNALRDLRRAVEVPTDEDEAGDPPVEHDKPDDETPEDDTPMHETPEDETSAQAPRTMPEPAPNLSHPDAVPFDDAGTEARPLPPPSVLESVLTELLGAVPEVKDHVLEAADALLDAAKALIEAADRVICQQRGGE